MSFKVTIDPGHGGNDPGAIDPKEKKMDDEIYEDNIYTEESKLVLKASKILNKILHHKTNNIDTILTRNRDNYIKLSERCYLANKEKSDIFLSIHANSFYKKSAKGTETLYYPTSSQGKELSSTIQNNIISNLHSVIDRGIKERDNLFVLKYTKMPAVLVELGFISNPVEERLLNNELYLNLMMESIATGIIKYLEKGKYINKKY